MSYKTILVHIDHEVQADQLIKAALRLADQNNAHLIGSAIAHSLEPYLAPAKEIALSAEITNALLKKEIKRATALQAIFEKASKDQNLVAEWRFDENRSNTLEAALLEQARTADVLMIGADYKDPATGVMHGHVSPVIMNSSRPTIVVPTAYQNKSLGDFVFVAWDGSRESSRAVFDALPILERATNVWLHRITSNDEAKRHGDDATRDMADTLARHGVTLELSNSTCPARKVGQELLSEAGKRGADCIVMGAYGHSRMHDFLLGGATRHMLANSTVPLFMSH